MKALIWRGDEVELQRFGRELMALVKQMSDVETFHTTTDMLLVSVLVGLLHKVTQRALLAGQSRYRITLTVQEAIAIDQLRQEGLVAVVPGSPLLWISDEADRQITGNWANYLKRLLA